MRTLLLSLTALTFAGCADTLPTYQQMPPEEAWRIVADRAAAIPAVSAEADVTLTGEDGESIRLDAALVMARPDKLRLRAWKLGHAVLDVTSVGPQVWLDAPQARDASPMDELGLDPAQLAHGLSLLPAWPALDEQPVRAERRDDRYVFTLETDEGDLTCEVDANFLTVERWVLNADPPRTIELDGYRLVNDIPWPHRVELRAGGKSAALRFGDVDLAADPDPRAFTPPPQARSLP